MALITARGISGNTYSFTLYALGTKFNPVGGIYMFLRDNEALYIGKTQDLSTRFDAHHKESAIRRHGANRMAVMAVETDLGRDAIERDLIASHKPICNDHLVG